MIKECIKKEILKRLKKAEQEHDIKVLYAIESGSRAWGFESADSDYDVRFVYIRPKDWYLSVDLEEKRDVIEYDIVDEIDINGWDVRKALMLFSKSNPAIVEWLQSSIVYVDDHHFAQQTRELLNSLYSIEKGIYHYRSMARANYKDSLTQPLVPLKKYFYVLRPLLSVMWLEKYRSYAPIDFSKLRALVSENKALDNEISRLLEQKKHSKEKEHIPAIPLLNEFFANELERLEHFKVKPQQAKINYEPLNALFHDCF